MMEYMKTAVLTTLVVSSMILSSMLWYSTPNYAPLLTAMNIDQIQPSSAQYQFDEIVIPREFVSFMEGDEIRIVYPNHAIFSTTLERIKDIAATNIQRVDSRNIEIDEYPLAITMRYYSDVPIEYISLLLNIDDNDQSKFEKTIENITIFYDAETERVHWLFEGENTYIAEAEIAEERLRSIITTISNTSALVKAEITEFSKQTMRVTELSNSLFADPTAIRQIQEKDQSVIYTDGSRGLRVNNKLQTLDYTDPTAEYRHQDTDFAVMIEEAIKFLNRHQSWVGNHVLAQINAIPGDENEYTVVFQQQYQGYPIIPTRDSNISEISIKMKNNRVIRMNRSTVYLGDVSEQRSISILSYYEIKDIIERRIDISNHNYDIYLGYYPFTIDESIIQLRPVWVLSQRNVTKNVFDAETGQEIRI